MKARLLRKVIRQSELYWRCGANFKPWITYQFFADKSCSGVQQAIIRDLKCNGIAIMPVEKLFGNTGLFEELDASVKRLENALTQRIGDAREKKDAAGFKSYVVELLGSRPLLNPNDMFVRFALEPVVLGIVNRYLGMYARLRFFNVWHNFASDSEPRNSQLWHRDPEDRYILKMFVYLSDVDEEGGPFVYAPGTHGYGRINTVPESFGEEGTSARRSNDDQMNSVVPKENWIKAVGPKGTIVFADTRGYHKGGLPRHHDRIAYNCMFTSQASTRAEYFERRPPILGSYRRDVGFALGLY